MAMVKNADPTDPDDFPYAVIRNTAWDYGRQTTSVDVGFWRSAADRTRNIAAGEHLPPARHSKIYVIAGNDLSRADIYTTLLAHPDFAGWLSDEVAA